MSLIVYSETPVATRAPSSSSSESLYPESGSKVTVRESPSATVTVPDGSTSPPDVWVMVIVWVSGSGVGSCSSTNVTCTSWWAKSRRPAE